MWFTKKPIVGLDIGSSCVKAIQLAPHRGSYRLVQMGIEYLPPETIIEGTIIAHLPIADAINRIFTDYKIKSKYVCTSLSGHSVIVKKITLPYQRGEDINETVRWESEQYIPYAFADVNLDFQLLAENPEANSIDVLLAAVKKEKIAERVDVITMADKKTAIIDVDAFAVLNAYEINYQPSASTTVALLNIGASLLNVTIVNGKDFVFTRHISVGGNHYTDFLQKEFNLSWEDADHLKHGNPVSGVSAEEAAHIIQSVSEIIALEISKTFDFFKTSTNMSTIDRMLVSGGSCHVPNLINLLSQKLNIPAEEFDSFRNISYDPNKFDPEHMRMVSPQMAIAVGLALRTMGD